MQNHILSIILFTPLIGAFVLLFVPKENKDADPLDCEHLRARRLPDFAAAGADVLGQR